MSNPNPNENESDVMDLLVVNDSFGANLNYDDAVVNKGGGGGVENGEDGRVRGAAAAPAATLCPADCLTLAPQWIF